MPHKDTDPAPDVNVDVDGYTHKERLFRQLDALAGTFDDDEADEFSDEELEHRRRAEVFPGQRRGGKAAGIGVGLDSSASASGPGPLPGSGSEASLHDKRQKEPEIQEIPAEREGVIEGTPASVLHPRRRRALRQQEEQGEDPTSSLLAAASFIQSTPLDNTPIPQGRLPTSTMARLPPPSSSSSSAAAAPAPKLTRSKTAKTAKTAPPSSRGGGSKRKRQSPETSIPADQQIFRGLRFYYIPDDDVAPKRKLRIGRARAYGAVWTRSMADATHVVVDEALRWADVEKFVARGVEERGGDAAVVLVMEEFPMDCIVYKRILPHDQPKYRVRGGPATVGGSEKEEEKNKGKEREEEGDAKEKGVGEEQGPQQSLEIKPDPRRVSEPETQTQTCSQKSLGVALGQAVIPALASSVVIHSSDFDDTEDEEEIPVATKDGNKNDDKNDDNNNAPSQRPPSRDYLEDLPQDELAEYIELMKKYENLPLDREDDTETHDDGASSPISFSSPPASSDVEHDENDSDSCHSDGERALKKAKLTKLARKRPRYEERFACQQGGTSSSSAAASSSNPNARTIKVLQDMCDYYDRTNDTWRTLSYRKAISTLRRHTTSKITTQAEALALPNVGARLAAKIEEIATTDRLRRLENAQAEPLAEVLQLFLKIYGVGTAQASRWIAQGFRTLEDLVRGAKLSRNQRMGIERYEDLNTRIPRRDVETLAGIVARAAAAVDPEVEVIVAGSYRRGAEHSGDVDFLVTRADAATAADLVPFLEELVARLTADGVLVFTVASSLRQHQDPSSPSSPSPSPTSSSSPPSHGEHSQKWHGCAIIPHSTGSTAHANGPIWRRVDFLLVPAPQLGAALLYFTGNDVFNRSMRLLASRRGMRLNQRGLYAGVLRGPGRRKITEGELVEGRDERRIFEVLGVKWREPWERWC